MIGVDGTFAEALRDAASVEFPGAFEEIKQGHPCVRITTREHLVHVVWCALGGVVVECNADVGREAQAGDGPHHPAGGLWLVRLWPQDREEGLANLKPIAKR